MRTVEHKYDPPNPDAECICGFDDSRDGMRYSNICPKHDGRRYDIVTEDDEAEASEARLR